MWSIRKRTLQMIMEASKDSYPKEFGALLRAEDGVIYEISLVPGTIQGDRHTMFFMFNKAMDFSVVGSVHSHPSGITFPSGDDVNMFGHWGPVHIIVGFPYGLENYAAFNRDAEPIEIKVV